MSKFKVYIKKGATNYKEKRLITAIEEEVSKRFAKNPELASTFRPARNFDELKELYNEYCVTDAEYTESEATESKEETSGKEETTHEEFRKGMEESVEPHQEEPVDDGKTFIDPFNDANPIVRDYVTSGDSNEKKETDSGNTNFEEPKSDKDAFEMPTPEDEKGQGKHNKKSNAKANTPPVNPKFDEMDNGKKKRSTKRFAKMIVEATCILAEKGCIWWTTKDITADKLAQYEINDEMDLQILLSLDDGQQATVRQWFALKEQEARGLFKVEEQDKSDLIDSLYEVMLEKGIAPTPMQELIINAVKTFVLDMGLKAYALSQQINNVLGQLREMKAEERRENEVGFNDDDNGEVKENPAVVDENNPVTQETGLVKQD